MPPPLILDPTTLDFAHPVATREDIARVNPHRDGFLFLDAVVLIDKPRCIFAGYHDVRTDAFWVPGHIPGRPLFPGVLMIEVAAQLSSFLKQIMAPGLGFFGLTHVEEVKFRGVVEPPSRFVVIGRGLEIRPRRTKCLTQGFVNATMVFEAVIGGMVV